MEYEYPGSGEPEQDLIYISDKNQRSVLKFLCYRIPVIPKCREGGMVKTKKHVTVRDDAQAW